MVQSNVCHNKTHVANVYHSETEITCGLDEPCPNMRDITDQGGRWKRKTSALFGLSGYIEAAHVSVLAGA